jgi:hypothetical protein
MVFLSPLSSWLRFRLTKRFIKRRRIKTVRGVARAKAGNRARDRMYGLKVMAELSEREFQRMFRLNRSSFAKLLVLIGPKLERNVKQAIRSSKSAILPVTKLAVSLRWLAGGSYLDIARLFGVDCYNFFNDHYVLWETLRAIDNSLDNIKFSLDSVDLENNARGFSKFSKGNMKDCVMAIDGWVCKTRMPTFNEVGPGRQAYRNRKGFYGIIII